MSRYIIRRVVQAIPLLVGISVVIFAMLQMTPGGPIAIGEGTGGAARVSPQELERMRDRYGLNEPMYVQYLRWAMDLLKGDWGTSFSTGLPVTEMIGERIGTTLLLTGAAFLLTVVIAFPVGIYAATHKYSFFDYLSTSLAFLGVAVPSFWFGIMLLYIFNFNLGWLPASGLADLRVHYQGIPKLIDLIKHLLMPVVVLGLISTASLTRYIRSSMLDVMAEDYLRTARAKGLPEKTVIGKHALKNAVIPVITVLVLQIPYLFLGAVITESIFGISGMGRLYIQSAELRDYPVLMGILIFAAALVIAANLIADILYGLVDPRIVYE